MKTRVKILTHDFQFPSDYAKLRFFETNRGKDAYISVDDEPSDNMRRYFEGCLVPVTFYTHPYSGWLSFDEARDALKAEFLPAKSVASLRTHSSSRLIPSTLILNKAGFRQFVDAIVNWLLENQLCVADDIDSENYKAWRDSAPAVDEDYPPLARLKMRYHEARP